MKAIYTWKVECCKHKNHQLYDFSHWQSFWYICCSGDLYVNSKINYDMDMMKYIHT